MIGDKQYNFYVLILKPKTQAKFYSQLLHSNLA